MVFFNQAVYENSIVLCSPRNGKLIAQTTLSHGYTNTRSPNLSPFIWNGFGKVQGCISCDFFRADSGEQFSIRRPQFFFPRSPLPPSLRDEKGNTSCSEQLASGSSFALLDSVILLRGDYFTYSFTVLQRLYYGPGTSQRLVFWESGRPCVYLFLPLFAFSSPPSPRTFLHYPYIPSFLHPSRI